MEISWKWLNLCLVFFFVGLCSGFPINLEDTNAEHTQLLTGLVAVLLTVCSIVLLAGCLCCHRKNGFKEFRNSPVVASTVSNLDHGHVNPIANGEFTIFTPLSPPHYNNNVFLANEQIITRTTDDYVYGDIDVSSWFNGSQKDFPRSKIKYIRELGKGWFGKVVEGAAQDEESNTSWTPVIVRILDAVSNARQRVLFLHDASVYLAPVHPNLLSLRGRCIAAAPLLLLQEYCPEGDLKTRLIALGNGDKCLQWCCQLTSAIKHLHENGLVHPDLAARNCLLTDSLDLKVGDYGLSPFKYPEDYYKGGEPPIPVRWRSPESLDCTPTTIRPRKLTPEANVWALGVVMWEICENGAQPYGGLDDDEVISKVFGAQGLRLERPSKPEMYTDYIFRLMQLCWNNVESRPKVNQIDMMLVDLLQVHKNTQHLTSDVMDDFDKRWEHLKPNVIVKTDNCSVSVDLEGEQRNVTKPMSPSLNNLHGSLDNLTENQPMEQWLENIASETKDPGFIKGLSEAMKTLDTTLDLENVSTGSERSFKPDSYLKSNIDFKLGPSFFSASDKFLDSSNQNDSLTDSMIYKQMGSSESETEEENWRRKVERGAYSEKVKLKSRSVADLMVLTHVDYSESESETPLPSLDYRTNKNGKKSNLETVSLNFSSEGNLLNVEDTFKEELRKLQVERRDSLLFVPDSESKSNSNLSLLQELNSPTEIKPTNQIFNVFNMSIDKFSPVRMSGSKLNEIININDETRSFSRQDSENKSDLGYATLHNSERNSDFGSVDGEHLLEDRTGIIKSEIEERLRNCEVYEKLESNSAEDFEVTSDEKNVLNKKQCNKTNYESLQEANSKSSGELWASNESSNINLDSKSIEIKQNLPDIIASLDQDQNQNCVDLIESNSLPSLRCYENLPKFNITELKELCQEFISIEVNEGNISILGNSKESAPDSVCVNLASANVGSTEFSVQNMESPDLEMLESVTSNSNKLESKKVISVPKLSDIIQNNDFLMDYIIEHYDAQDEENTKDVNLFKESQNVPDINSQTVHRVENSYICKNPVDFKENVDESINLNTKNISLRCSSEKDSNILDSSRENVIKEIFICDQKDTTYERPEMLGADVPVEGESVDLTEMYKNLLQKQYQGDCSNDSSYEDECNPFLDDILCNFMEKQSRGNISSDDEQEIVFPKDYMQPFNEDPGCMKPTDCIQLKVDNSVQMKTIDSPLEANNDQLENCKAEKVEMETTQEQTEQTTAKENSESSSVTMNDDVFNIASNANSDIKDVSITKAAKVNKVIGEEEISETQRVNVVNELTDNLIIKNDIELISPNKEKIKQDYELSNIEADQQCDQISELDLTNTEILSDQTEQKKSNTESLEKSEPLTPVKPDTVAVKPTVAFDLSEDQEKSMPNSLTHLTVFTSTPFGKKQELSLPTQDAYSSLNLFDVPKGSDDEELQFSSNFMPIENESSPKNSNNKFNYSLETWDNFLGKSFDSNRSNNDNLFDSFSSEPQSMVYFENQNEIKDKIIDKEPSYIEEMKTDKTLNKTELFKPDGTFVKEIPAVQEHISEPEATFIKDGTFVVEDKKDETFNVQNGTYVLETAETDSDEKSQSGGSWEAGEGWFLHPQSTSNKLTGNIEPQPSTSKGSYVGFGMDDEVMAAIRNELLQKLPHAQGTHEKLKEEEELENSERNEVFLRYNVYNTPLSPIPEESFEENEDNPITTSEISPKLDDFDSDLSDFCESEGPPQVSSQTNESPIKDTNHRHSPSQGSCCSNDTLFNLEDFVCANEKENVFEKNKDCLNENSTGIQKDNNDLSNLSDSRTLEAPNLPEQILKLEDKVTDEEAAEAGSLSKDTSESTLQAEHLNTGTDSNLEGSGDNQASVNEFLESERNHTSSMESLLTFNIKQVPPLPSPEDKPWKSLPASLLTYNAVTKNLMLDQTVNSPENLDNNLKNNDVFQILESPKNSLNTSAVSLNKDLKKQDEKQVEIPLISIESQIDIPECSVSSISKVNLSESDDNLKLHLYEDAPMSIIEDPINTLYEDIPNEAANTSYENLNDIINEADYVNMANLENTRHNTDFLDDIKNHEYVDDFKDSNLIIESNLDENRDDLFGVLTDIRFSGPADSQLMSTSFSESNDVDEQDWDSGSDTRSSSSGEFIWKLEDIKPMEGIIEESTETDVSTSDEEGETPEFVPSAWDKYATPTKSALRSPEKSLERSETKKAKGVWFKKQKYHCVYEYPREPESPVLQSQDLWKPPTDYAAFSDWEFDAETYLPPPTGDSDLNPSTFTYKPKLNNSRRSLYFLTSLGDDQGEGPSNSNNIIDDFGISSSSRPFDVSSVSSQFFPGGSSWPENVTPDSGLEDSTPGSVSDSSEIPENYSLPNRGVLSLRKLAAEVIRKSKQEETKGSKDVLGGLRHTRNKLKLDLPPSPSAFSSARSFTVEPISEPVILREKPTFSTFGKSRFLVQHVDTPTEENANENKNVCFEALPYKPIDIVVIKPNKNTTDIKYEPLKKNFEETSDFTHRKKFNKGEASLLDSADEDSGIESSTLERKSNFTTEL